LKNYFSPKVGKDEAYLLLNTAFKRNGNTKYKEKIASKLME
jgi:hypothetical protein